MSTIQKVRRFEGTPRFFAEYVWVNESNKLRSATRIVDSQDVREFPEWTYDCFFSDGVKELEVTLYPRAGYKDPFRCSRHKLVMCDTNNSNAESSRTNDVYDGSRPKSEYYLLLQPQFFFQQAYFLVDQSTDRPIGFPGKGDLHEGYLSALSGPKLFGRHVADAHFKACDYAGIYISAMQAEAELGHCMFEIRSCIDQGPGMVWMARYILQRIAAMKGLEVRYGERDDSAYNTNLSTWVEYKADKHGNSFGSATKKGVVKELLLLRTKEDREDSLYSEKDEAVEDNILPQRRIRVGNLDPYVFVRKLRKRERQNRLSTGSCNLCKDDDL